MPCRNIGTMSIQMMRPTFTKGDRLRKARELTGLDQKAFAEAMGLHRDSVRKYESTGPKGRA